MAEKQASTITLLRTLMGGLACFAAFVLGLFFTFARFGGSRRGQTGLLFNPTTQSAKLIAVWKEIEPLPLLVSSPTLMFAGYLAFGIGWAFLYRSIRSAWPPGIVARGTRLALLIWSFGAFFELQGPVNLFHEPAFPLSIALVFWTVASTAAAMATVAVIEGASNRPLHLGEEIAARVAPEAGLRQVQP
jgi:hypothetical protein